MDSQNGGKTNVLVLGSPRTGTSLVTKQFFEHGWDIGDRCREAMGQHNPPRWEDPLLRQANEGIFAFSEAHPMMPSPHMVAPMEDGAIELLLSDKKGPWVMKDPGMAVLYPFWKNKLPDHRIVATIRHPMAASKSLQQITRFPPKRQPKVWLQYITAILAWERAWRNVSWVHYPTLRGLPSAINAAGGEPSRDVINNAFKDDLVHHQPEDMGDEYYYFEDLYRSIVNRIQ